MRNALQIIASMVFSLVFIGTALFRPAWTLHYWQAWTFIAVFTVAAAMSSLYLAVRNPAALQRRLKAGPTAETRPAQRIIISAIVLSVIATLVISAFDHRFGWSAVPVYMVVIGNVLVFAGLSIAQLVVVQNGYAAATITVEEDQPLITTGLYGLVRHPMYFGTVIMMVGTPPALGSLWGLLAVVGALPVLAARISDEERMLVEELPGYGEYMAKVRHRLVPGVW
ncbi:MAG: methyltransferase family protein [Mycobacterium sp.]